MKCRHKWKNIYSVNKYGARKKDNCTKCGVTRIEFKWPNGQHYCKYFDNNFNTYKKINIKSKEKSKEEIII